MKKLLALTLALGSFAAQARIYPGDVVMEDHVTRSLQTVDAISGGKYLLSDGQWYSSHYINELQDQYLNIRVGEEVMEDHVTRSILEVKAISDRKFLLSDEQWYSSSYINKLQYEFNNISVGERVMEDHVTRSFQTVEKIADNKFLLSDGQWYSSSYINKLDQQYLGINVNDQVTEDHVNLSVQTVEAISDGKFYLSDGQWYSSHYISKVETRRPRYDRQSNRRNKRKVDIAVRDSNRVTYDHNEYLACYERPKTRLVSYTDTKQAKRGRKKVIGGVIGAIGGKAIGSIAGKKKLGNAISVVGAAVAIYGAVEIADASEIIYVDNGYDCQTHYQIDRRVYKHRVDRQKCVTKRYYSNRWGSEHEYFETTCSGRKYMTFDRTTDIWYN